MPKSVISFIILFSLISNPGYAQNRARSKKFINAIVTDKNINYQDSVDWRMRAFMHNALKNTKIIYHFREDSVDYIDSPGIMTRMLKPVATSFLIKQAPLMTGGISQIVSDSLVLTDTEIAYANSEIDKMRNYKWGSNLLLNSKLLLTDSLQAMQKRWDDLRNKPLTGLSKKERETWFKELYKKSRKEFIAFHELSAPVFLRNDTYCLFYYGGNCINTIDWGCGSGNFMAYKKVNGKWVLFGIIAGWMT